MALSLSWRVSKKAAAAFSSRTSRRVRSDGAATSPRVGGVANHVSDPGFCCKHRAQVRRAPIFYTQYQTGLH